jgi:hypothetical protein
MTPTFAEKMELACRVGGLPEMKTQLFLTLNPTYLSTAKFFGAKTFRRLGTLSTTKKRYDELGPML